MEKKHKANQKLQRKTKRKESKIIIIIIIITKEERTKERRERITSCESPSPRLVE